MQPWAVIPKGREKLLVLTDKGKKAIPDVKIEKVFHKQGSWEHEYWKFRVGEYYRKKGYKVTFEYNVGDGKTVDLVAEKDERRIAVEIETGKSDAIYNVQKCLNAGFYEIISVACNKLLRDIIKKKYIGNQKIKIVEITDFN